MGTLREPFLAALPTALRVRAQSWPELDGALQSLVDASRGDEVELVEDAAFVEHVAARLPEDGEFPEMLDTLHAVDLRLACACARGHAPAHALFRAQFEGAAAAAARRAVSGAAVDEIVQDTTSKLLVPGTDGVAAIAKYAGRGRLSKWVQTVALRLARSRTRKKTEEPVENIEALSDRILEAGDPELEALKRTYRAQFKQAFSRALEALTPRQRNLLRLELIDRTTAEAIAKIYDVHVATIWRWRADTRKALRVETRRCFEREMKVGQAEFQSIMRLIQSQLDVSLPRLLGEDEG